MGTFLQKNVEINISPNENRRRIALNQLDQMSVLRDRERANERDIAAKNQVIILNPYKSLVLFHLSLF